MNLAEFAREFVFPLRSAAVIITLVSLFLLIQLAGAAGMLGIWLAALVYVAAFRYFTSVSAARARGTDVPTPGIELFTLDEVWNLFPAAVMLLVALWSATLAEWYGDGAALVFATAMALLVPAIVGVLVITHSPLQALNPMALYRFVRRTGGSYLFAPLSGVLIVLLPLSLKSLPSLLLDALELYLIVVFFAVIGALLRKGELLDEVDIPEPAEIDAALAGRALERQRTAVLNHAYGFFSRGNRAGGLQHIEEWLQRDPEPNRGSHWFIEQMLRWENPDHALFFAQREIGRLIARGDRIGAVKLTLRGRLVNERFRPLPEDRDAVVQAARECGNDDLAETLLRL